MEASKEILAKTTTILLIASKMKENGEQTDYTEVNRSIKEIEHKLGDLKKLLKQQQNGSE